MTRPIARLLTIGLFSASVLTMVLAFASAQAVPKPTISIAEVPPTPSHPPALPPAPNMFAPALAGAAAPNGSAKGQTQGAQPPADYLVVTAVNRQNPRQSCALMVVAGTMSHLCVGNTVNNTMITSITQDAVILADGRQVTYATTHTSDDVPAVSNGLGNQTVPVTVSAAPQTPVPRMATPAPSTLFVPRATPNVPNGLATPTIINPNAIPTASVINPGGPL